jgi:hypothetical protein
MSVTESEAYMGSSFKVRRAACPCLQALSRLGMPALLALAGCAQMPTGPSVPVIPTPYKPIDVFAAEDKLCRDRAATSITATPAEVGTQDAGQPVPPDAQYRYDVAYQQCMYESGNLLPDFYGSRRVAPMPSLPPAGVQPAPPVR